MTPLGKLPDFCTHDWVEKSRKKTFWFDYVIYKCKNCKIKKEEAEKIK